MDIKTVIAVAPLALLCACQPKSDETWPEDPPLAAMEAPADDADASQEAPQMPPDAPEAGPGIEPPAEAGTRPMGLLGRPDGPILPTMAPELVQIAVDLANEELEDHGYDVRAEAVTTYQGTIDEISFYAGKPGTLGWTPGKVIFVSTGELCDVPPGYDHRLLVWVLAHEVLHTVGFEHGDEMKALTDALGQRCRAYCGESLPVEAALVEEPSPDPGPYVEPSPDCEPVTRHCFQPDPAGGFTCINDEENGVELCANGVDDDCDGYTDEDLGKYIISDATCFPITD